MDIVYAIGRAFLIGLLGLFIAYQGRQLNIPIFNLQGRMDRTHFILSYVGLMIILYILNCFYQSMINIIVTLPAYWGLRFFIGFCQALLFPLFCTAFARRLQDLNIPALPALIWPFFIMFVYTYNALPSTSMILHAIILFVACILMLIPGDIKKNNFGPPSDSIKNQKNLSKNNPNRRKISITKK